MLCRFLWTSSDVGPAWAKVSRKKVTILKQGGGLGIWKLTECSTATLMKHLGRIASSKETLWVLWFKGRYFKTDSIWTMKTPHSSCSWDNCSILMTRGDASKLITHLIGNGNSTYLWLEPWHTRGVIWDSFSCATPLITSRDFTTKSAWNTIRTREGRVHWYNLIWFKHLVLLGWH